MEVSFELSAVLREGDTYMNTTSIAVCTLGYLLVSKMVRKMRPRPPMMAKAMAKPERIFSEVL